MAYQALYRQWRPRRFADIVGQDRIVTTLVNQIATGRVAHAYLFCGSRGTGKTSTAKVLARAINCLTPENGEPCGHCAACEELERDNSLDVAEIDAASNNGVDEIRDLRERVKYAPTVGNYKVYIIDEVHMLSTGAFNALLKTLEEPPAHAVFILATTEPQRLPATILSRCQRFDFRRIGMKVIADQLRKALSAQNVEAEDEAVEIVARAAEGGMRDAYSILDICLAYGGEMLTAALAREVLGASDGSFLFAFADALIDHDAAAALKAVDQVMREGRDPAVFSRECCAHFRRLLVAASCESGLQELLEITADEETRLLAQAKRASDEQIARLLEAFMRAENDMKWSSSQRAALELCVVRCCRPEREAGLEALAERIGTLETAVASGARVAKREAPKGAPPSEAPAPKEAKPRPLPANDAQGFQDALKLAAKRDVRMAIIVQKHAKLLEIEGDTARVELDDGIYRDQLILPEKRATLEAALSEAFGRAITAELTVKGQKDAAPSDSTARKRLEKVMDAFDRGSIDILDPSKET